MTLGYWIVAVALGVGLMLYLGAHLNSLTAALREIAQAIREAQSKGKP